MRRWNMIAWALTISLEIGDRRESASLIDRSLHNFPGNYEKMKPDSLCLSNLLGDWRLEGELISHRSLSPQSRKPNGGT
jgi:hypothetical protein